MARRKNRFRPGDVLHPGITLRAEREFPGNFEIQARWQPGGDAIEVHQGGTDRDFDGFFGKHLETLGADAIVRPPVPEHRNYALSPDRRRVAFDGLHQTLAVLDFSDKDRVKRRLTLHDIGPIFWSPDGTKMAVSCSGGFRVYDAERLHVLWAGHGDLPAWSPDGRMIATRSHWNAVAVYETEEGESLGECQLKEEGHVVGSPPPTWGQGGDKIFALQHAFSLDGGRLKLEHAVRRAYDKDRRSVVGGWNRFGRLAVLLSANNGQNRLLLRSARRPEESIAIAATGFHDALWHPDGRTLALIGHQTARILDIADHPEDFAPTDPRYADGFAPDVA